MGSMLICRKLAKCCLPRILFSVQSQKRCESEWRAGYWHRTSRHQQMASTTAQRFKNMLYLWNSLFVIGTKCKHFCCEIPRYRFCLVTVGCLML